MEREDIIKKKDLIKNLVYDESYIPMTRKEMANFLQVPKGERKGFNKVIDSLFKDGTIETDINGKLYKKDGYVIIGKFMASKSEFGFVRIEGEDEDVFIPKNCKLNAMDGDIVQIIITSAPPYGKREGKVVNIKERSREYVVGTIKRTAKKCVCIPDNEKIGKDIFIEFDNSMGAVTGTKVVVKILNLQDEKATRFEGDVVEILGHIDDPGVDILSVIRDFGIPDEFPEDVTEELKRVPDSVPEEYKSQDGDFPRVDFRDLLTVTIDGEDAKDLDDAISLERDGENYILGVHIADVSEYVKERSPLDKEALKRGTSVYLADRVIPMIPHKLSNGICSLNQGEDRLTLSCMMTIDSKGEILEHSIVEGIINVDRRMSYNAVSEVIENKRGAAYFVEMEPERLCPERDEEFVTFFELMYELKDILYRNRHKKGSVDFDFPEAKIILDESGKCIDIKEYTRNDANRVIEEFMLAANKTVAEDYFWQELPFVYRTHDYPDYEKCIELRTLVQAYGYDLKLKNDTVHPKEIQKLIKKIKGSPEESFISMMALRSMKRAVYSTSCDGHFGLAFKYYCHFTSPIRRYPDLQIHRIIKENIHGKLSGKRISHYEKMLPEEVIELSRLERRADDCEREVEAIKKAQYMAQFVGETFDGVISGVTNWGIYVTLPNTCEGMVRLADLYDDYYIYLEDKHMVMGEEFGKMYTLGMPVKVTISNVNEFNHTIDMKFPIDMNDYSGI
ncbi:MAG: ribonuclease R [Lachnospiraceae bacterium]|nr:ribonuclease R [Lachnospiraceae bacterium]